MRKYKILISIPLFFFLYGVSSDSLAQIKGIQPSDEILIQGKWKSEQDEKSIWEFKDNGKLHDTYIGDPQIDTYTYSISSTPPICPDAKLSVEKNVKYLKLINEKYNTVSYFYIYGLNEQRLTVMDAVTGHIFPMIKAED